MLDDPPPGFNGAYDAPARSACVGSRPKADSQGRAASPLTRAFFELRPQAAPHSTYVKGSGHDDQQWYCNNNVREDAAKVSCESRGDD